MMIVSELIKALHDMPDDALVALEVNGVYAFTRSVKYQPGKDGTHNVVWLKAHHIRLAASNFK
jgi:hypothetical protein